MITTSSGYKIYLSNPITDTIDSAKAVNDFFIDLKQEGVWFAITGKHLDEWFIDIGKSILQFIIDSSDILIVVGTIIMLLIMFGSTRARKWLYWTICGYVIIKSLGLMI